MPRLLSNSAAATLILGVSFLTMLILPRILYASETCLEGYVWREAFPNDYVCVTPETRAQAANDNRQAAARRQPGGGAFGPDTCRQGYVWREARPEDHVCVAPETRAQTLTDNAQAAARRSSSQVPQPPPGTGSGSAGQRKGARNSIGQSSSFWTTVPGVLTALGGLIAAIAALITAIRTRN
jgi:hypothetical protein